MKAVVDERRGREGEDMTQQTSQWAIPHHHTHCTQQHRIHPYPDTGEGGSGGHLSHTNTAGVPYCTPRTPLGLQSRGVVGRGGVEKSTEWE